MKAALVLTLLTVVGLGYTAVVKAPEGRSNLNIGYLYPGDRLLNRTYLYQPAIPNTIQYQDFIYRGTVATRISAIQATEVGYTQYATPSILYGGIGYSNVTLRFLSARGYGYYYLIDIWGR